MMGSTIINLEKEKFVKPFKIVIYKNNRLGAGDKMMPLACCTFIKII